MDKALEFYREKFKPRNPRFSISSRLTKSNRTSPRKKRKAIKPPKGIKVVDAYLFAQHERAPASRELARLASICPLNWTWKNCIAARPKPEKLAPLLQNGWNSNHSNATWTRKASRVFEAKVQAEAPPPEQPFEVHYTLV